MLYLLVQTWIWILTAGLFGLFIGWLIWGREARDVSSQQTKPGRQQADSDKTASAGLEDHYQSSQADAFEVQGEAIDDGAPQLLPHPKGEPDDLKRIKGVGPVMEKTLKELGIFHFHQIAAFTEDNVRWIDNNLAFPGRVNREQWVRQAEILAQGASTEFSDRYDERE
ncbi:MAG: hypothetical protein WBM41_02635 [Arenicellales bacterium]